MIITVTDYINGKDDLYPNEYTLGIKAAAELTVEAVNGLLKKLEAAGVKLEIHPVNRTVISSGWRPPQINSQVKGAAVRSKHMTAQACDLYDPDGTIDDWLMDNQPEMEEMGIWSEHPSATKGWAHIQIVPPASGRVIFYP